jgi:iron complex outermembrane recepter protein
MAEIDKSISKKVLIISIMVIVLSVNLLAQKDTSKTIILKEVHITDNRPVFITKIREIDVLNNAEIKEKGAQTLSEATTSLPGVSQITTGAISNPVINGLYGDRILIVVAGLKLEDQKWEDEYGLGFSDIGVERIEMIKGPASLMFGSNAMGGVVNIVGDNSVDSTGKRHMLNFKLFSNTYGIGIDYGFKKPGKNILLVNCGIESHADYSDGNGNRVPNTRFALNNINLGYIIRRKNFRSENHFIAFYDLFGFVADSADLHEDTGESRLDREFEEAHYSALQVLLSSINSIKLNETTDLNFTLGVQNNFRQEQERSNEIELSLLLNTFSANGSIIKKLGNQWTLTNGISGMIQTNTNYADRIIIPDASIAEGSIYSYISHGNTEGEIKTNFEAGLRYDFRHITTYKTESEDTLYNEITPFKRGFSNLNGSIGENLNYKNINLKFDLSSGYRTGNLAELSAHGLHEGTSQWYIGNPEMKSEKCFNINVSASWHPGWIILRGSAFRNRFIDFIYLNPTNEKLSDFSIYRYEQSNATLQGFEVGTTFEKIRSLNLSLDYSFLDARRDDGSWLPFTPANRLIFNSKFFVPIKNSKIKNAFLSAGAAYCQKQNHIDVNEQTTPGYWLLNAGAGMCYKSVRIFLTCRNMTNTVYFDHLSRLKYYGLNDMGRNIVLNMGWQF